MEILQSPLRLPLGLGDVSYLMPNLTMGSPVLVWFPHDPPHFEEGALTEFGEDVWFGVHFWNPGRMGPFGFVSGDALQLHPEYTLRSGVSALCAFCLSKDVHMGAGENVFAGRLRPSLVIQLLKDGRKVWVWSDDIEFPVDGNLYVQRTAGKKSGYRAGVLVSWSLLPRVGVRWIGNFNNNISYVNLEDLGGGRPGDGGARLAVNCSIPLGIPGPLRHVEGWFHRCGKLVLPSRSCSTTEDQGWAF